MSPANQKKQNPKLDQFLKEINRVCDHYQYSLKATLQFSPNGIVPTMSVVDKPPKPLDETQPKDVEPAGDTGGGEPSKPVAEQPASPDGGDDIKKG